MEQILTRSFRDVHEQSVRHKVSLRTGAWVLALQRVAEATRLRVM